MFSTSDETPPAGANPNSGVVLPTPNNSRNTITMCRRSCTRKGDSVSAEARGVAMKIILLEPGWVLLGI